jgi:hypothetical protein
MYSGTETVIFVTAHLQQNEQMAPWETVDDFDVKKAVQV